MLVAVACLIYPFSADHEFIAKIAEMGDRPAKGGEAELQEYEKNLTGRPLGFRRGGREMTAGPAMPEEQAGIAPEARR